MLDKVDSVLYVLQMNVFDRQYETMTSRKYCHMLKMNSMLFPCSVLRSFKIFSISFMIVVD